MLTKEECLEALHYLVSGQCSYCWKTHGKETDVECQESKQMLEQLINEHFELVEKATPKKAILVHDYDGYVYECPNCHEEFRPNYILDNITWKGCPFCLQALDWGKEDE